MFIKIFFLVFKCPSKNLFFSATVEEQLFSGSVEGTSSSSVKPLVSRGGDDDDHRDDDEIWGYVMRNDYMMKLEEV